MRKFLLFIFTLCLAFQAQAQKAYIDSVYDFCPAPGQFVNSAPAYYAGETKANIIYRVDSTLCRKDNNKPISLGAYGGYVVFGFDHMIENIKDHMDFQVLGNAFWGASAKKARGGSCEPGIILVSKDVNGNGLPDDPWYEIAGSEYNSPATIHHYRIVYEKPDEDKVKTPDTKHSLSDTTYVHWTDNQGGKGYVYKNTFHHQSYWPQWLPDSTTLTFEGTKLADNYIDESGKGTYYVQYSYTYGYADNAPNADSLSYINIDWAVDADGNPANLDGINFVKVYTGVNQYCGWLGETSTEVYGALDLHMTGRDIEDPITTRIYVPTATSVTDGRTAIYTLTGTRVDTPVAGQIYIVGSNGKTRKVVWK
ncbi:MAG: hypothetical protein PUD15_02040 [Prevotella sp.]|nr:hypothetical protein [Prevotella sp.]